MAKRSCHPESLHPQRQSYLVQPTLFPALSQPSFAVESSKQRDDGQRLEGGLGRGCFSPAPSGGRIRCQGPPSVIFPSFSSHWHWGLCPQGGTQRGWRSRGRNATSWKCPSPIWFSRILNFWQRGCGTSSDAKVFIATAPSGFPSFQPSSPAPKSPSSPRPVKGAR